MKSLKILTICLFILISSCSQNQQKEKKVNYTSPETQLEKFSYSIGVNIATSMKEKHKLNEIDGQSVAKGFHDVVYDLPLDIKLLDTDSILNEYFYQLLEEQNYEQAAEALKLGEEFLEENEIENDCWIVLSDQIENIFNYKENNSWNKIIKTLGKKYRIWSNSPDDITLN